MFIHKPHVCIVRPFYMYVFVFVFESRRLVTNVIKVMIALPEQGFIVFQSLFMILCEC